MPDSFTLMPSAPFVEIGKLIEKVSTRDPSRDQPEEAFTYIDLSAVDHEKKVIVAERTILNRDAPSRARQIVRFDDILVSTVRPNLNGVARVTRPFDQAIASTGFCILRPKQDELCASFLFHWVRTPSFVRDMVSNATGASYPAVSDKIVQRSLLPLPPLSEQRRIAAILDQADALRAKRRAALAQLDDLARAIFVEMFGDPANKKQRWPLSRIGDLAVTFSDGPFGSNLKSEHYVKEGVRVIRLQNIGSGTFSDTDKVYISEEHFKTLSRHECRPGDILIGTMGDPNLRACIQPEWIEKALNKADCVQMRINTTRVSAEYVEALLNHPSTEQMAQDRIFGQTRLRISMGRLREMPVPVPPREEQTVFSARIKHLRMLLTKNKSADVELNELFSSLQHRAFSGAL